MDKIMQSWFLSLTKESPQSTPKSIKNKFKQNLYEIAYALSSSKQLLTEDSREDFLRGLRGMNPQEFHEFLTKFTTHAGSKYSPEEWKTRPDELQNEIKNIQQKVEELRREAIGVKPGGPDPDKEWRAQQQTQWEKERADKKATAEGIGVGKDGKGGMGGGVPPTGAGGSAEGTGEPVRGEKSNIPSRALRAADTGALGLFGYVGAADLPKDIQNVSQGWKEQSDTGTYGYTRLGSGQKFDPTTQKFVPMSKDELDARSTALKTMDTSKLVGDAAITTAAAIEVPAATAKGVASTQTGQKLLNAADIEKVKNIPGVSQLPKVSWLASKVFPAAVVGSKAGQIQQELINKENTKAAKTGLESLYWLGEIPKPGNRVSSAGIGHELLGSGVQGLYGRAKTGNLNLDVGTSVDAANTLLGTYLTQAPYINAYKQGAKTMGEVAEKEAAEAGTKALAKIGAEAGTKTLAKVGAEKAAEVATKTALKTGAKAAAKQIPLVGSLVALPFAAIRAAEGDWAGAGLELAGSIPVAGLAAQGYLAMRDYDKAMEDAQKEQNEALKSEAEKIRQEQIQKLKNEREKTMVPQIRESACEKLMRQGLELKGL